MRQEEHMPAVEIQSDRNSFSKISYFLRTPTIFVSENRYFFYHNGYLTLSGQCNICCTQL